MKKVIINGTEYRLIDIDFNGDNLKVFLTKGTYIFGGGLCIRSWIAEPGSKKIAFWDELSVNTFPKRLKKNEAAICRYTEENGGAEIIRQLLDSVGAKRISDMQRFNDMDAFIYDFTGVDIETEEKNIDETKDIRFE